MIEFDVKKERCENCQFKISKAWCDYFKQSIDEFDDTSLCFAFEEREYINLFEAYEAEQKKRKAEKRK